MSRSLHFASGQRSLEASLPKASSEASNIKKETVSTDYKKCPGQVDNNATKSAKQILSRRGSSRRLSVAHAAIKAIDLVAKRSG